MKSISPIILDGLFGQLLYFSIALRMQAGFGKWLLKLKAEKIPLSYISSIAIPQLQLKQLPTSTLLCQA